MNLSKYINDLLYRYDCVIIPDFGGFVTNKIGAKIDENTHTFYPPNKQITFNSYLKHNDGLLANHISATEGISFIEANKLIAKEVMIWNSKLHIAKISLEHIGHLFLNNEKQLCFEPEKNTNFLIESFGLSGVPIHTLERLKTIEKQEEVLTVKSQDESEENGIKVKTKVRRIPAYIKYAAGVAILMTFGISGFRAHQMNKEKIILAQEQEKLEHKIQEATFIIDNPLPTINLSVVKIKANKDIDENKVKPEEVSKIINKKSYHIIAGAFRSQKNAEKRVRQLKKEGFNASIVGKNKWDLVQVAYGSFNSSKEGKKTLKKIRKSTNNQAWMLVD